MRSAFSTGRKTIFPCDPTGDRHRMYLGVRESPLFFVLLAGGCLFERYFGWMVELAGSLNGDFVQER
jgi:hypothetical protein